MINDFKLLNDTLFRETNIVRNNFGLKQLIYSEQLSILSSLHSTQMAKYNFFAHENNFNSKYRELKERADFFKLHHTKITENIADFPLINTEGEGKFGIKKNGENVLLFSLKSNKIFIPYDYQTISKIIIREWMNSKGHRKNILDKEVTELGCGAVLYKRYLGIENYYMPSIKVTQNFGKL